MKEFVLFLWELIKITAIALAIVIPIRYFLFQPFLVSGASMEPTFQNGDYLLVDEISYRFRTPKRGEVLVFRYPNNPSKKFIKRVVGLPGENVVVEAGKVKITTNGKEQEYILNENSYLPNASTPGKVEMKLEEDEYFVLGDNRNGSYDSRGWGALAEEQIVGKVFLRAWPIEGFETFSKPKYPGR